MLRCSHKEHTLRTLARASKKAKKAFQIKHLRDYTKSSKRYSTCYTSSIDAVSGVAYNVYHLIYTKEIYENQASNASSHGGRVRAIIQSCGDEANESI